MRRWYADHRATNARRSVVGLDGGYTSIGQAHYAVSDFGDGRIVRDHHCGSAQRVIDARDYLQHRFAGGVIGRAGGLVAQ